jgi:3-oxoacyl-[acyl-carrier-protein] synthase-3
VPETASHQPRPLRQHLAATIPISIDEARRVGRIGPVYIVVIAAFGSGVTWGGAVIRL